MPTRQSVPGASTLGVAEGDITAAREELQRLESAHQTASAAATERLHEMRDGVAEGAERPTAGQVQELFAEADQLGAEVDAARGIVSSLLARRRGRDPQDQRPAQARRGGAVTMASRFLAADQVRESLEEGGREQRLAGLRRVQDLELLGAEEFAASLSRNATVSPDLAAQFDGGPLVPDDQSRIWPPAGLPVREATLLDWIRVGTTDSDSVPYTRQTTETSGVAGKAAGVAADESTIVVAVATEEVVDRLTILPVPERNLEDEGRIRSFLDGRLRGMLRRDAESQVVSGPGTAGTDMTGITNWAGVGAYSRGSGEALADALHKGITNVRTNLFEDPDGIGLTAADMETMILARSASDGHYENHAGPFAPYPMTVWGKRSAVAHVLAAQQAIVGRWDELELVIRMGPTVQEFLQDSDNVRKRLVTLRALYRAAAIIERPQAFCVVTTTPVP